MDKIDAYDKEQLQGMGWLFDETQASDSGTLLVGEYGALRFDKAQSLTPAQQAQARENIGITQGLLNDADFIAELKTKLGLT